MTKSSKTKSSKTKSSKTKSSKTKSSKVESPTTWPFILYCMCCCCLPLLLCCIFVIVILINGGNVENTINEEIPHARLVEGSDADELCIKYDWKFYTGIVLFILQLVFCFYFAHVAADYVRQDDYPSGLWKIIPG